MNRPGQLRRKAEHYRRLASGLSDRRTIDAITELAAEYEEVAAAMEKLELIRRRAYEIWEEQGRPDGLHADHWHDAERELAEDEHNQGGGSQTGGRA